MEKHSFLATAVVIMLFVVVSGAAGYYLGLNKQINPPLLPAPTSSPQPNPTVEPPEIGIACTMDAKICPDGSAVGRMAPDCEFAPCPTLPDLGKTDDLCVDHQGNLQNAAVCAAIPPEARACKTTSDCMATCSKGCISRTWAEYHVMNDCEAIPEYNCGCTSGVCRKTE